MLPTILPPPNMTLSNSKHTQAASTRELKQRILSCLDKLSDRDTHSAAATELESIAKTLSHHSIPPFLSSISATHTSDKSPVRKQCLNLISLLSITHGNTLSPHLSKLLSSITRRLRDPDSSVRSSCIHATASISSHITKPPFTLIAKPLIDALVTEQDHNSQIAAALCLSSAIDSSPDPQPLYLRKLLPRLHKLLKCDSFKAKPALLTVIGSVIGAAVGLSQQAVRNLVECLVEFVISEDWATRKAAAEALLTLAVVERDMLSEFKVSCLKIFEAKRFDKVKVVRETMNQMLEAWKEIPDSADEVSLPRESQSSSKEFMGKEVASDGRYPPGSRNSRAISSGAPQIKKKHILANSSNLHDGSSATIAQKRFPLDSSNKKICPPMFRKLDCKRTSDGDEKVLEKGREERDGFTKTETKRALFSRNTDEKMIKFGGSKGGSRVVPCDDEISEATGLAGHAEDIYRKQKESEDLSLIRKQLVQIENRQSSLFDLLEGFIGSSQNGMRSLESRVHGLELALDEISYDLSVVTARRVSYTNSAISMCCKLPGVDFFSSKLWRRTQGSRLSSSAATPSVAAMRHFTEKNKNFDAFRLQSGGGFIVNPLATPRGFRSSHRVSMNISDAI